MQIPSEVDLLGALLGGRLAGVQLFFSFHADFIMDANLEVLQVGSAIRKVLPLMAHRGARVTDHLKVYPNRSIRTASPSLSPIGFLSAWVERIEDTKGVTVERMNSAPLGPP